MKNFSKVLLVLLVLLFLLGCSAEEGSPRFVIQGYKQYTSLDGYSFQVPDNWNKIDFPLEYVSFVDSTGSRVLSTKPHVLGTTSYNSAIDNIKSALSQKLVNNRILYEEPMRIDGKETKKIVYYYGQSGGEEFKHGLVIINDDSNNRVVLLSFTTYLNFYDTDAVVFQNAISTFKFD